MDLSFIKEFNLKVDVAAIFESLGKVINTYHKDSLEYKLALAALAAARSAYCHERSATKTIEGGYSEDITLSTGSRMTTKIGKNTKYTEELRGDVSKETQLTSEGFRTTIKFGK